MDKSPANGSILVHGEAGKDARFLDFFTKAVNGKLRVITAVISSGEIDRDNEIILPAVIVAAWPSFMRNPVLMASHQHRLADGKSPVIGKVIRGWRKGNEFLAEIEFTTTPLAEEYWELYRGKTQRAFSIGFIPKESEIRLIDGERIRVHTRIELLEISAVPVSSNRDALSKASIRKQKFVAEKKQEAANQEYYEELVRESGQEYADQVFCSEEESNRKAQEWIDRILLGDKQGRLPGEKGCIIEQCCPRYNRFMDAYEEGMELVEDVQGAENKPDGDGPDYVSLVLPDFVLLVKGKR